MDKAEKKHKLNPVPGLTHTLDQQSELGHRGDVERCVSTHGAAVRTATANYESLRHFETTFARGLPALLYHKIDRFKICVRRRGLYVSPCSFRLQMHELRHAGFRSVAADAIGPLKDERRIIITFDDGFSNVFENALPVLHECGFRAINFLVSGFLGGVNTWDLNDGERPEPLMDTAQIRDWLAAGHDIGAHSVTHAHLMQLPVARAREEITASKKALEDRFTRPVTDFAYPFGEMNPSIRALVAEAGFERAWSVQPNVITHGADPLALPRFPVVTSLRKPLNLLRSFMR
jgi:peptidoglycan/xylan/chitin deacetylase (PgdA/CDA1 family)